MNLKHFGMFITVIIALLISCSVNYNNPNDPFNESGNDSYGWTIRMGGVGVEEGSSITTDTSGNVYITGGFEGTVNFEAYWGGIDNKTSAGSYEIFVTKINSNGTYGWTHRIGNTAYDPPPKVSVDTSGNVYITSEFEGTLNFEEDWGGTDNKTSIGGYNTFVTKINSNGTYAWTRSIVSESYSITTDTNDNVYITGAFGGTVNFEEDWGGTDNKTSAGDPDIFITKINSNGTYAWTHCMGSASSEEGTSITTDTSGNIYTTGIFTGTINFADDWGGTDNKTSVGDDNTFITKINTNGTYGWTHCMGSASSEYSSITADTIGNIYITGMFTGTVNFADDWGGTDNKTSYGVNEDVFVTKINSGGTYSWTRRIGGTNFDYVNSITTDTSGNIYITGNIQGTVNFAADWGGTDNKTSAGDWDIFVTKINGDGTYDWTRRMGGAYSDEGYSIATDANSNIYITGIFTGTVNFAADWGGTDNKTSAGDWDIFVTKLLY